MNPHVGHNNLMANEATDTALHEAIVSLAGLPDDASAVEITLEQIARLTAWLLPPVAYASVTAIRDGAPSTVAMSVEIARAVDEAQYAEGSGPCLDALDGNVVEVSDMTTVLTWPRFRQTALSLGLHGSLSLPLFAARGVPIASLNLYSHQPHALTALGDAVGAVFHRLIPDPVPPPDWLDDGSCQLVTGLAAALAVQQQIQVAIGVLMTQQAITGDDAYLQLRTQAAESGSTLIDAARLLADHP